MIQGVIFDVDGVLLDSVGIWMDAGERYLRSLGVQAEPGLGAVLWPMSIPEAAAWLRRRYDLAQVEPEIEQGILDTVREYYYREAPLKAGARTFLEGLRGQGIPAVAASTSVRDHLEHAFARLGIREYFRGIVTPAEAGCGKTDPRIYQMTARLLHCAPFETCVFEDAVYAARTARAAGCLTAGVYDRYSEAEQEELRREVDIYLPDLTDFPGTWKKIQSLR